MFLLNSTTRSRKTAEHVCSRCMAKSVLLLALFAGCSLDRSPQWSGSSEVEPNRAWAPRPATDRGRLDAAIAGDEPARSGSMSGRPGPRDAGAAIVDSGATRAPSNAGAGPTMPVPAVADAAVARDASAAPVPAAPDASTAPTAPSGPTAPLPDASTAPPSAPLDASMPPPPSTTPDAGAPQAPPLCQPGRYTGAFSGSVRLAGAQVTNVVGTLRAELELDPAGNGLLLRNARATGSVQGEIRLRATLSGRIDCTSLRLEDGLLEDGRVNLGNARNNFDFSGTIAGEYAPDRAAASGTWSGQSDDIEQVTAEGAWSLSLQD